MIYVVRVGKAGPLKVGSGVDPGRRIRQLQTGNPDPIQVVKIVPGDRKYEQAIHSDLAEFRIKGEWYSPTAQVLDYIARLGMPEYELRDGVAYLVLWRRSESSPTDYCPFCGKCHDHGKSDGHRVAHCIDGMHVVAADGTVLRPSNGYILRTRPS